MQTPLTNDDFFSEALTIPQLIARLLDDALAERAANEDPIEDLGSWRWR